MADEVKEEVVVEEEHHEEPKKKGLFGKVKSAILPDAEEQAAIISTAVRIAVLAWSGGILTLNYVAIPGVPQQKIDPTFIASVFTGVLASFGIQTASKKGDGTMKMNGNGNGNGGGNGGGISKKDLELLIEKASQTGPTQTIRIEQAPIKITTDEKPYQL
jgi:hypothetical protein|tara:strand:- start:294 stop:773 length:480 start_codon:yes stop_codon:yes gene_type:complete